MEVQNEGATYIFPFLEADSVAVELIQRMLAEKRRIEDERAAVRAAEDAARNAREAKAAKARRLEAQRRYELRTGELERELREIESHLDKQLNELRSLGDGCYLRRQPFDAFGRRSELRALLERVDAIASERPTFRLPVSVTELRDAFSDPLRYLVTHNDYWSEREVARFGATLHDRLQLTKEQAIAAVCDERQVLVSAPAGSGKTRMLEGKGFHLIESGQAKASEVLFLTFASRTRKDLKRRIHRHEELRPAKVATFHALGRWILLHGRRLRDISPLAKNREKMKDWVDGELRRVLADERLGNPVRLFIERGLTAAPAAHGTTLERYFEETAFTQLIAIDGTQVRSCEELIIANWFYMRGIEYQYEPSYFKTLTDVFTRRRYCPDFYVASAKRLDGGDDDPSARQGVYHEHLALNENNETPSWIDCERYVRGVQWKRDQHNSQGTVLVETRSSDFRTGEIFAKLDQIYRERVKYRFRTNKEVVSALGKRFSYLSELFVTFFDNARAKSMSVANLRRRVKEGDFRARLFLDVYEVLAEAYKAKLEDDDAMDFDAMIHEAREQIESGQFVPPWKYIVVDEYQDVSENQIRLLEALNRFARQLFCVGDRRQAIYGFRGAESEAMHRFEERFRHVDQKRLTWTHRSSDKIAVPANKLYAMGQSWFEPVYAEEVENPRIIILGAETDPMNDYDPMPELERLLKILGKKAPGREVMILGRYRRHVPLSSDLPRVNLQMETLTIHRAKGLEAYYSILTDAIDGFLGFPVRRARDPIFQLLGSGDHMVEERSLMYVALTRAKQVAYVLTNWSAPSLFVEELLGLGAQAVKAPEYVRFPMPCPKCGTGRIVRRAGRYVCKHHPVCDAYFDMCPCCSGVMLPTGDDVACRKCEGASCAKCAHRARRCPSCGDGFLKQRRNSAVGCSRYKKKTPVFSCGYYKENRNLLPLDWKIWRT